MLIMSRSKKAAINFIFITLLIDVMGWGLIIPVMPQLISQLKNIPVNEASPYGAWLLSAYAITQFVFAPVIGNLSDKYGRSEERRVGKECRYRGWPYQ